MSSTHSSVRVARQPAVGGILGHLGSQIEAAIESLDDQISETLDDLHRIGNSPTREDARISNSDAALSILPLSILGVPGPEYSLRRSARLAAKASEQQVYATDPDFWAIDERTDKRDLNPEPAAEARLHLTQQSRTSPFDDVEVANSTREGWGVTIKLVKCAYVWFYSVIIMH